MNENEPNFTPITWRLHLHAPPEQVYELLATDAGRARFWAERTTEREGQVHFVFPNGYEWTGRILEALPPRRFVIDYIGYSTTTFELASDGAGATDLTVTDNGVPPEDVTEVTAGWVSVLLALKAAADFGVDLRNHDRARTWDEGTWRTRRQVAVGRKTLATLSATLPAPGCP